MPYPKYDRPTSVENMLGFYKSLPALSAEGMAELTRISSLDICGFSEADVREEIITPMLRVFGYAKGSYFSIDREKPVKVAGKHKFIDYSVTLFSENFWLIEAKKPQNRKAFGHREILQALQYAAHPDINASLMVMCDGQIIEIFDREHSLETPIVRVAISSLVTEADTLRKLLAPWQNWFFQKRRLARLADKIFDKEYSLERGRELVDLVKARYENKRPKILENHRQNLSFDKDNNEWIEYLRSAEPRDLVEGHFFMGPHTLPSYAAMADNLVERAKSHRSHFIYSMFPETPRDANAEFWGSTLFFLMRLEKQVPDLSILPSWLGPTAAGRTPLEPAIQNLISLCLTSFEADRGRQAMMLLAFAYRRLAKLLVNLQPDVRKIGSISHLVNRFRAEELSWQQAASSEKREILRFIDQCEMLLPASSLKQFTSDRGNGFQTEVAILHLKEAWRTEQNLLQSNPNYAQLRRELSLGEVHPTEDMQVSYDYLGHLALCLIDEFPKWREYTLETHRSDIEEQAAQGLFKARELLGTVQAAGPPGGNIKLMAKRFFLGDEALLADLHQRYGGRYSGPTMRANAGTPS